MRASKYGVTSVSEREGGRRKESLNVHVRPLRGGPFDFIVITYRVSLFDVLYEPWEFE